VTPNWKNLAAQYVVELLGLAPYPEGVFHRETFRDNARGCDKRSASTAIYYLLPEG
jgi:hypothetical protein